MKTLFLLGRVVFGGFFLYNGLNHFWKRSALAGYARSKGVPQPDVAVSASGVALLIGGASILLGIKPKLGALAVTAFLASVSPTMHDFWRSEDPNQRTNDMVHFMKNLALLGATLSLMALREPWPMSVPLLQRTVSTALRKVAV